MYSTYKNTIEVKTKSLGHSEIILRPDGIIQINLFKDQVITDEECAEMVDVIEIFSNGREVPVLTIAAEGVIIEKEAREFSASYRGLQFTKADAFVVTNFAHKLIANFYLKVNKPAKPTKVFNSEQEAVKWLTGYM